MYALYFLWQPEHGVKMKMLSTNRQLIMTNLKYYTYLEKTQIPK